MTKAIWKLSKPEQLVALLAVTVSLVARGIALLPGYAIDDYSYAVADPQMLAYSRELAQGRPGMVLLREILRRLDVAPHSSLLGGVMLTLILVWVGILICRMWRIEHLPALCALVVLFTCLHPYQAEAFTFRLAVLPLSVALGLAFYAISTCSYSRRAQIAAVLLLAAAILTYQVVLNYLVMALLFSLVFYIVRPYSPGEPFKVDSRRVLRSQLLTFVLSVVCATLVTWLIPGIVDVALRHRTQLLKISEFGTRAPLVFARLRVMFGGNEAVLPIATKWLLALTPLAALALAAFRSPAGTWKELSFGRGLPFVLAIAGGVPASLGVVMVLHDWWPVPRVCAHVSIFWAGLFALVFVSVPPRSRRLMLILSGLIVLSFVGTNNHIFQDQLRVNLRDIAKANRIISRLEAMPDFAEITGVVLVGGQWGYASPLTTVQGDMNISALFAPWSKTPLLNEVSGASLQPAPPAVLEKANHYCQTAPIWPSALAVTRIDSFAVLCQGN